MIANTRYPSKVVHEIRAIVDLTARGWHRDDICKVLKIKLTTYYRRLWALDEIKRQRTIDQEDCDR